MTEATSVPSDALPLETTVSAEMRARSRQQACQAARVCDDLRGKETIVLDLTGITPLFDYFVISTGTSRRQMHAIAEETDRVLKRAGSRRHSVEGYESGTWIVQDFGDVVVHVFTEEARKLYDLEHLWGDAPRVDWEGEASDGEVADERQAAG